MHNLKELSVQLVVLPLGSLKRLNKVLDRPVGHHRVEPLVPAISKVSIVEQTNVVAAAATVLHLLGRNRDANACRAMCSNLVEKGTVATADVQHARVRTASAFVQQVADLLELGHRKRHARIPLVHTLRVVQQAAAGKELVEDRVAVDRGLDASVDAHADFILSIWRCSTIVRERSSGGGRCCANHGKSPITRSAAARRPSPLHSLILKSLA